MNLMLNLIPLIVILILLFKGQHMLFAGLTGAILAILIGRIDLAIVSRLFIEGINSMLSITVPIIYAASAAMVSKAGSVEAFMELCRRALKGKISVLAGVIVLIQGFITYMAGLGAGNTMITAPLAASAVGAIPEVVGAMAIISTVGVTTSPASAETILTAKSAGKEVIAYVTAMRPYAAIFYLLAAGLAVYGVEKKGRMTKKNAKEDKQSNCKSNNELIVQSIPVIALLVIVIMSNALNSLLRVELFTPATAVAFTGILTALLTPLSIKETCDALVEGSGFILTTLFNVGMFLACINTIRELGVFEQITDLAGYVPEWMLLPIAMIIAFLIAIPSGAFVAGALSIVLPTLTALGLPVEAMGFVAIATGLGAQISPVQINVAALAKGFEKDVMEIIKDSLRYVIGTLILLIIISIIALRKA